MKIKNKNVGATKKLLLELELKGTPQRLRTRFCKLLDVYYTQTLQPELAVIVEKYAIKDKDGKVELAGDGSFTIPYHAFEDYKKETDDLDEEVFEITMNEGNKAMLLAVADLIMDDDLIEVSGNDAYVLDDLYEAFEEVVEFYQKEE